MNQIFFSLIEVGQKLEECFPSQKALKWDKTSFSFLARNSEKIRGIITCLDVTEEVILKAKQLGFNLIISRHPLVFLDSLSAERKNYPYKQKLFWMLRRFNISVYSLHTNFERTNSQAAREIAYHIFCKENYIFLEPTPLFGGGLIELTQGWSLEQLIKNLKKVLKQNSFRVINHFENTQIFRRILILPGAWSAKEFLNQIKRLKVDVVLTSDLKWSDWVAFGQTKTLVVCEVAHLIEQYWELSFKAFLRSKLPNMPHFHYFTSLPYETIM